MSDLIKSPGESPHVKGVDSNLDSMGRGNAEPIDGNKVVLTVDLPYGPGNLIKSVND